MVGTYIVFVEEGVHLEAVETDGALEGQETGALRHQLVAVDAHARLGLRLLLGRILATLDILQPVDQVQEAVAWTQHETKLRWYQHTGLHRGGGGGCCCCWLSWCRSDGQG